MENFYDGYVVNAIMDACYRSAQSRKWEPVLLDIWRGQTGLESQVEKKDYDAEHYLIKEELLPDGRKKVIIKNKNSGDISQKVI